MAKTYLSAIKYQIVVKFEIDGIVDKHDIIGAVFGQSEGLLGNEMDLKELQKGGKIGRIEVIPKTHLGKTTGEMIIPSSMDMAKTSLLAAAIEAVDKVGPCESSFKIEKIDDTRRAKRDKISERARELLKGMQDVLPESQELAEGIREGVKAAKLVEYGIEKLPAGPDVEKSEEVIVVEGRADVINMLKHGINNVIGMNGTKISQSIVDLSKGKSITLFIDGDRGGMLNLRKLQSIARVDYVARAPIGKEVEELSGKEIIMALRRKISPEDLMRRKPRGRQTRFVERKPFRQRGGRPRYRERAPVERAPIRMAPERAPPREVAPPANLGEFAPAMQELQNSLKARLLDAKSGTMKEVSVRDLLEEMQRTKGVNAIVFDGIVTKRLVEEAEKQGIKTVVGVKKGKIEETGKVRVVTLS